MMRKVLGLLLLLVAVSGTWAQERRDTLVVSRDGTGDFRTLQEAVESARAFMDYTVTIYVKNGVYKEKVIVPSWVENIDIIGEDRDKTIITYDDHANINKMGTFRTYTVKVEGSDITFKNLTIENNAAQLGQAVALHTEGDRLKFINCRILGNQDTIYTGAKFTRLYFKDCYIDGTTDFIFGPSTALFENCMIHSKRNSYVTAASTPKEAKYGYIFKHCKLTAEPGVDKVYLGRPWRPYAYTLFIECELGKHIVPAGWHNWGKQSNEETARYMEYKNTGEGANVSERVAWSKQLTKKEAEAVTVDAIFGTQKNLTQERLDELSRIDIASLPLDQALKTVHGKGQRNIYVFADPYCGFCGRLEETLKTVDNVTIYTFVTPLLNSSAMVDRIYCAAEPEKAWDDWMLSKKEPPQLPANCKNTNGEKNLLLFNRLGMQGAPCMYFDDGYRLEGAVSKEEILARLREVESSKK